MTTNGDTLTASLNYQLTSEGNYKMHEYHIYMGADHRGFEKKEALFELIKDCHENVIVEDLGYEEYNEGDDFNDPAKAVAKAVSGDEHSFGVLMCGSGQGVCIQANRIKGARAVRVKTPEDSVSGREHDWANIVCMPADELSVEEMEKIVKAFCHAKILDDERHQRRMRKLEEE